MHLADLNCTSFPGSLSLSPAPKARRERGRGRGRGVQERETLGTRLILIADHQNKSVLFLPVTPLTDQICTECLLAAVRRLFYQPGKTARRDSVERKRAARLAAGLRRKKGGRSLFRGGFNFL